MEISYILPRKIQQLSHRIVQRRNRDLKALGLTAEQADALLFFYDHRDSSAADLRNHLGITHQAARAIVERMVTKGLLTTRVSPHDARYKTVALTEQGEELYDMMQHNCTNFGDRLLEHICAPDREKLFAMISQALENMESK